MKLEEVFSQIIRDNYDEERAPFMMDALADAAAEQEGEPTLEESGIERLDRATFVLPSGDKVSGVTREDAIEIARRLDAGESESIESAKYAIAVERGTDSDADSASVSAAVTEAQRAARAAEERAAALESRLAAIERAQVLNDSIADEVENDGQDAETLAAAGVTTSPAAAESGVEPGVEPEPQAPGATGTIEDRAPGGHNA